MIRILRAPPGAGVTDRAWERATSVWSGDREDLLRALAGSLELVGAEADAVRSAAREIAASDSADVLVAANGAIFRVIPRAARPAEDAPSVAPAAAGKGFTSFPGTNVLFIGAAKSGQRLTEALRFVGYDARHATAGDGLAAIAAIRRSTPRIVLAGSALLQRFDPTWLTRAHEVHAFGLVALGAGAPEAAATLGVPIRLETVADVLDPLLEAAQRQSA